MPLYEYQGQQYDIATDDPQEAKSKILKHLGTSSESTSALAAGAKSAVENTVPALGGLAAGGAAIAAGAPLIAGSGPFAPVTALGLGLAGGFAGSSALHALQNQVTGMIPDSIKEATGFGKEQRALETKEHPYASFAGQLAPNLAAFRPGAVAPIVDQAGKTILGSTGQRVAMGGIGGAVEAGSELINEGKIDPLKIGMAATMQGVAATPTALGRKLMMTPKGAVHDPEQPIPDPTVNTEDAMNKAIFLDKSIDRIGETIAYHEQKIQELTVARDSMANGSMQGGVQMPPSEAQLKGIAKLDAAIASHATKIETAHADIESHNDQIDALSEFTGYPRDQLLPPKETSVPNIEVQQTPEGQVASIEAQMKDLELEFKSLSSKGAALSTEQRTRLSEVESQYNSLADEAEALASKAFGETVAPVPNDAVKATEAIKAAKETGTTPELPPISIDTVQNSKSIPPTHPQDTLQNITTFRTDTGDIGYHATNQFINSLINIPLAVTKRFISPWAFKNMFRNNRMVADVGDMAIKARHEATAIKNELNYGRVTEDQFKADFGSSPLKIMKLNKVNNQDGLLSAIEQVKFKDIGNLIDGFVAAYRDGVSPWKNVDKYFPGTSQEQRNLVRVIDLISDKMHNKVNASLSARGLPGIQKIPGYFPVHNVGKFYVDKTANGVLLERNWFFSKAEAEAHAQKLSQADGRIVSKVNERKNDVDYESIMDILNQIIDSPNKNGKAFAEEIRTNIAQKASSVGQHKEHRSLIRGFSDERIGNQEERGKNFAQGLVSWVDEYANSARKRNLMYDSSTYMSSKATEMLKTTQPNAYALTKHFLDNELNLYGTKELTTHINGIGEVVNNLVNDAHFKLFGEHLKGDVIDSAFNVMKRFGYNMALTAKPVTWVSQALTSLQSSRMIFKAGGNPIEAMGAAMKGIQDTFFKTYDEDAMRGFYHVSQNMDVLHKTIHHDLGGLDATSVNKSALDKWYSRLVGEKLTEGADTFSRVVSYNMAYNVLKSQGMKGKKLWEAAGQMAAENMIPMGRENLPSIYKEAGWVGTSMSPLKGFIHGSMSNLVTDVKDVVQNPSIANSLALTANVLSMLILGGLAGLPLVADYEYIRQMAVKAGMGPEALPNWTQVVENRPTWAARGMMSALTDVDLSASTRYQSILKPYGDIVGAKSLADISLPFSVGAKAIGGAVGVLQDTLGNSSVDQARKNWDSVLPAGPLRGLKEDIYNQRGFMPFGKRGEALIERGPTERAASYLGSTSVEQSKAYSRRNEVDVLDKHVISQKQKATDLLLSNSQADKDAGKEIIIKLYQKGDISSEELKALITNQAFKQNRPLFERMITNNQGQMTTKSQARKLRNLQQFGYEP